jgi:excisionase family DNA binding protein
MDCRWLSVQEAHGYARISRALLYQLIKAGKLKARKIGRRTLLCREEIDALIEGGADGR